jgi:uracil-DNA glycosylase
MIEHFADKIDPALKSRSGKVFYSGRLAFSRPNDLYLLGFNPGGNPIAQANETVGSETTQVLTQLPDRWSAYRDESWRNKKPGTHGMQPRVLHMLRRLGRDPQETPASNLIFVRSSRENTLQGGEVELVQRCWKFHEAVIDELQPSVIVCFGGTTGKHVRDKLKANRFVKSFTETNDRHWRSQAHAAKSGQIVVTATHPSIADWTTVDADPTPLIQEMLRAN